MMTMMDLCMTRSKFYIYETFRGDAVFLIKTVISDLVHLEGKVFRRQATSFVTTKEGARVWH